VRRKRDDLMHDRHPANAAQAMKADHLRRTFQLQARALVLARLALLKGQDFRGGILQRAVEAMKTEILKEEAQAVLRRTPRHHRPRLAPAAQQSLIGQIRQGPSDGADRHSEHLR